MIQYLEHLGILILLVWFIYPGKACFVCESDLESGDAATLNSAECLECGPDSALDLSQGQWLLEHIGAHILHALKIEHSVDRCGLCSDLLHSANFISKRDEVHNQTWRLIGTSLHAQWKWNFHIVLQPIPQHLLCVWIFPFSAHCVQTRRTQWFGSIMQRLTSTATTQLLILLNMNISGCFRTSRLGKWRRFGWEDLILQSSAQESQKFPHW